MTIEEKIVFIDNYKNASNAATGSKYDSNSNVTDKNIATMAAELPKKDNILLQRAIMQKYIAKKYGTELATQYIKDLKNHLIYRHDETTGSGGFPYCASISLYPFLIDGMTKVGGTSRAPQHTDSFIGGLINLIFMSASQFAGAIATPEFLTYMDHFLRVDYGNNYIEKLMEIVDKRNGKTRNLKDRIEDWFAQFVYTINQPAAARGNQSVFLNIAYFDEPYFKNIFKDFVFPDGDEPNWETTKTLQKLFMKWFNKERTTALITFPVETMNLLVVNGEYADKEMADFAAEMWSEGASFFCYQSDSVDSLSSCCRLRNALEEEDRVFSYTLGAGAIETGSKAVITINLNRAIQDAVEEKANIKTYIADLTNRVHKYLEAFNDKIWDDFKAGLLTIYSAGFINLDKQFLTVGVNGFVEAAEFLGIKPDPKNVEYREFSAMTLGVIEDLNRKNRSLHCRFNLEFVPGESLGAKNAKWDRQDGYQVPRDVYNSYFYPVEDESIDPVEKFYFQGTGFADICSGGVALHNNLTEHLTAKQYRILMDVAVDAGCNYWTYNIKNTICNDCGFISKHTLDTCPRCGSQNLDYATRVIGYLKRISNFSEARQAEAHRRSYK